MVVEIADGDTIRVEMDGVEYPVRYIGIDSPEVQHNEWFGSEARDANAAMVAGKEVLLEKDKSAPDQPDVFQYESLTNLPVSLRSICITHENHS